MYDVLARYYDLMHAGLTADRDYILGLAESVTGRILELGCGTGRLTIPLAEAGHPITGVDNSAAMLRRATERVARLSGETQPRIELIEADFLELSLNDRVDSYALVLLPYNTLLHFRREDVARILQRSAETMRSDGRLFIDLSNPFAIDQWSNEQQPAFERKFYDPETGQMIRQYSQSQLDRGRQRLHTRWTFEIEAGTVSGSNHTVVEFDYWYHYPHQLELLLQRAGLRLEALAGDYDGSPFDENSERLLMTAEHGERSRR